MTKTAETAQALVNELRGEWEWGYADGDVCERCEDTIYRPDVILTNGQMDLCFACAAKIVRAREAGRALNMTPETKHTPGALAAETLAAFHEAARENVMPPSGWEHLGMVDDANEVAEADLHAVISQRDDLLAALEEIANEPCDHGPGFCPKEVARAAIAKATGGAK